MITPKEATKRLRDMQSQIIHGKNTFGEIADLIEGMERLLNFVDEAAAVLDSVNIHDGALS